MLTTREGYDHKPTHGEMPRLTESLEPRELTVTSLARLIERGHSFRNRRNMDGTDPASVIMVDIDDLPAHTDLEAFTNSLTISPTLAYTTPSDLTAKNGGEPTRRVRILYVLDTPIDDAETFARAYRHIIDENCIDTADNCGERINQIFHGNGTPTMEWMCCDGDILPLTALDLPDDRQPVRAKKSPQARNVGRCALPERFIELLKNDWRTLFAEFAHLKAADHSQGTLHKSGLCYVHEEGSYYTTEFSRWERDTVTGRMRRKRWKDGEGRRRKIYMAACIYLTITPDLTLMALVYNLALWTSRNIDNTADTIGAGEIVSIAENAMLRRTLPAPKSKKFTVNPESEAWAAPISRQKRVGMCRRALTDAAIAEHYDPAKSIRENQRMMREAGVSVGRNTIARYLTGERENDSPRQENIQINEDFWKGTGGWLYSNNIGHTPLHISRLEPPVEENNIQNNNNMENRELSSEKVRSKVVPCEGKSGPLTRQKGESLDDFIARWYDPEKSLNGNLKWAKAHGVKVAKKSLIKYAHEHGGKVQAKNDTDKPEPRMSDKREELVQRAAKIGAIVGVPLTEEQLTEKRTVVMDLIRELEATGDSEEWNHLNNIVKPLLKSYPDSGLWHNDRVRMLNAYSRMACARNNSIIA